MLSRIGIDIELMGYGLRHVPVWCPQGWCTCDVVKASSNNVWTIHYVQLTYFASMPLLIKHGVSHGQIPESLTLISPTILHHSSMVPLISFCTKPFSFTVDMEACCICTLSEARCIFRLALPSTTALQHESRHPQHAR